MLYIVEGWDKRAEEYDGTSEVALDLVSNICWYRSVKKAASSTGCWCTYISARLGTRISFPALQEATMALTHLGDRDFDHAEFPKEKLEPMLRNAINGDIVFGIEWDLIPGPLLSVWLSGSTGK